jgi:nitroreductase
MAIHTHTIYVRGRIGDDVRIMDAIELLTTRASNGKLGEPAPDEETLRLAMQAAVRAPDHAGLHPTRVLLVRGEARLRLGEVMAQALLRRTPSCPPEVVAKERNKLMRAPLVMVIAARVQPQHPKIPAIEQVLSTGCAAHAILLALHARGFAGMWRTGEPAYDDDVKRALGLAPTDAIVGFVYAGTPTQPTPMLKRASPEAICQEWTGHAESA